MAFVVRYRTRGEDTPALCNDCRNELITAGLQNIRAQQFQPELPLEDDEDCQIKRVWNGR